MPPTAVAGARAAPGLDAVMRPGARGGERLYLHHTPPPGVLLRGTVLYVHPWAEELNKSRRMAALASRAMAGDGWAVLQIDLGGCGDSGGSFAAATWRDWMVDVADAFHWLDARHASSTSSARRWIWGLRAGALLARDVAESLPTTPDLLFWQPVASGKTHFAQFMRLKAASHMADGGGKSVLAALRAGLAADCPIEVGGYTVSAALAHGLERSSLTPFPPSPRARLACLECSTQEDAGPSPAVQAMAARWQESGWLPSLRVTRGPSFWQTTEIEEAPELVLATLEALREAPAADIDCGQAHKPTGVGAMCDTRSPR